MISSKVFLNFIIHAKLIPRNPPPGNLNLPIIERLVRAYEIWHEFTVHIPKISRYTLGDKIDSLFIETIESVYTAIFLPRDKKYPYIEQAAAKLNLAKFFLEIAWRIKSLDNKKYIILSEPLDEIGKMLGGWLRQLSK